jgi:carbon storage regulator CsrA
MQQFRSCTTGHELESNVIARCPRAQTTGDRALNIFSRRRHESLLIGPDITILVLETRVDAVRLAVNAPKSVTVQAHDAHDTFRSQILRKEGPKSQAAQMTIGQRLRSVIEASGQSLNRLEFQLELPQNMLDDFVHRNYDLPLSAVQRIASHFRLELIEPDSERTS